MRSGDRHTGWGRGAVAQWHMHGVQWTAQNWDDESRPGPLLQAKLKQNAGMDMSVQCQNGSLFRMLVIQNDACKNGKMKQQIQDEAKMADV